MEEYVIVFEDGRCHQSTKVTQDDFNACDDGILTIIRTSDMTEYYDGVWKPLKQWRDGE